MTEPMHQLDYANLKGKGAVLREPVSDNIVWRIVVAIAGEILWTFIALFAIGGILTAFGFMGGFILLPAELIVALTLIAMYTVAMRTVRRRRGLVVLGYVRQSVRLNLPLHRVLLAGMASETGKVRNRLEDFAALLQAGMPITSALAGAVPEVSPRLLGKLQLAEQTGRLSSELSQILGDEVAIPHGGESKMDPLEQWYPPIILASIGFCIWLMAVFAFPRFKQILADFNIPVPLIFRWADAWMDWIIPIAPIVALILLVISGRRLREAITGRPSSNLFRRLRDRIIWSLPIAHGMVHDRAMADICLTFADSVEVGFPLETVLNRSAELHLNTVMHQRLERWTIGLEAGLSVPDAAKSARLPALLVQLLRTTTASPVEVFRFTGRFYQARLDRRGAILRGLYLPVVVGMLGLVVACVALAWFQPLQVLIISSGPNWGGP